MQITLPEQRPCAQQLCAQDIRSAGDRLQINELTRNFVRSSLKTLMKMLDVESGAFFLFNPDTGSLALESFLGHSEESAQNYCLYKGRSRACLSLPLFTSRGLFGLVKITTRRDSRSFSSQDLRYTAALCEYICRIVEDQINFNRGRNVLQDAHRQNSCLEKYAVVGTVAADLVEQIESIIAAVRRYAVLVGPQIGSNERCAEYLSLVQMGIERISDIIVSLSSMRATSNDHADTGVDVDINRLLDEAVGMFGPFCEQTVRITVHHGGPLVVNAGTALRQVFANIIKNAIEAMPHGGQLNIISEATKEGVKVIFRDTGCGITPQQQTMLFTPFLLQKPRFR